jgi:hypothetical protein
MIGHPMDQIGLSLPRGGRPFLRIPDGMVGVVAEGFIPLRVSAVLPSSLADESMGCAGYFGRIARNNTIEPSAPNFDCLPESAT